MTIYFASVAVNNGVLSNGQVPIGSGYNLSNGCTISTVNHNVTVLNAGLYRLCAVLNTVYSGPLPAVASFSFYKNGAMLTSSAYSNALVGLSNHQPSQLASFEMLALLNANDVIDLRLTNTVPGFGLGSGLLSVTYIDEIYG